MIVTFIIISLFPQFFFLLLCCLISSQMECSNLFSKSGPKTFSQTPLQTPSASEAGIICFNCWSFLWIVKIEAISLSCSDMYYSLFIPRYCLVQEIRTGFHFLDWPGRPGLVSCHDYTFSTLTLNKNSLVCFGSRI